MSNFSFPQTQSKSRFLAILAVLVIFLNIIADQSINTVLLELLQPLDVKYGGWLTTSYMAISIPGSLILAGWSDFHCRRKTMILALVFAFLSFVFVIIYKLSDINGFGLAPVFIKALLGNVTPVCLATLADIISKKRFRNVLALAIVVYSIGIWIPIYFRSSIEAEFNFLLILVAIAMISIICTILFVKDSVFDHVKFYKNPASFKSFFSFLRKDTKLIVLFLISPIIAPALLCFFFGEISYYQSLLRGELLPEASFYVFHSLVLAIGYYIGTAILLVLGWLKIKDITCIKIGLLISFLSSGAMIFESYSHTITSALLDILMILFSIGFALIIPSLFASISKISEEKEQGKIYGSLDSTDTFAMLSSELIIKRTKFFPIYLILFF